MSSRPIRRMFFFNSTDSRNSGARDFRASASGLTSAHLNRAGSLLVSYQLKMSSPEIITADLAPLA